MFAVHAGLEMMKRGAIARAIEKFREGVRLAPDNAQAHYQLAMALRRTGARAEAAAEFETARRLTPSLRMPETGR